MTMRWVFRLAAAGTLLLLLVRPSDLASCGPYFRTGLFARIRTPENENAFFSGHLGCLQPTYRRPYLAMAYRILLGIPLNPSQVASLRHVWPLSAEVKPDQAPIGRWEKARLTVPGTRPLQINPYRSGADHAHYRNCGDDAFLTAVRTLNERIRLAGASSAELRDWLAAQDIVFGNCYGQGDFPVPASPASSARIVADREYQIAAAHFYYGDYDLAKAGFEKIANDPTSPWYTMAPYLIARMEIRNGDFEAARSKLQAILADPKLAGIHGKSASLLGYVETKIDPEKHLALCTKRLLLRNSPTLRQDLVDYSFLHDYRIQPSPNMYPSVGPGRWKNVAQDEMSDWIDEFQWGGAEDEFVKRWQKSHSLPWLVAALYYADKSTPRANELIEAARRVPVDSPGWPMARFHAVRLLIEKGEKQEAREVLSEVSGYVEGENASTTNAFRAEQMIVAEDLAEFLDAAPRTIAGEWWGYEPQESDSQPKDTARPMLDSDASAAFNAFVPLSVWLKSIRDSRLPQQIRTNLAQAGFVRAVVLDDPISSDIGPILRELKPSYAAAMDAYLAAPKDRRLFEATFWLAHHPEASPMVRSGLGRGQDAEVPDARFDLYRDNWWCAAQVTTVSEDTSPPLKQLSKDEWKPPGFLSAEEQQRGAAERKALKIAGGGPEFLSKATLAWARALPNDPRLPEALALAVKSSRSSCTDAGSAGPVSEAFRLLHRRFPHNRWTEQTPYWFK